MRYINSLLSKRPTTQYRLDEFTEQEIKDYESSFKAKPTWILCIGAAMTAICRSVFVYSLGPIFLPQQWIMLLTGVTLGYSFNAGWIDERDKLFPKIGINIEKWQFYINHRTKILLFKATAPKPSLKKWVEACEKDSNANRNYVEQTLSKTEDDLPEYLRCGITKEIPTVPVSLSGTLYNYSSLIQWHQEHARDPVRSGEDFILRDIQPFVDWKDQVKAHFAKEAKGQADSKLSMRPKSD